MDTQIHVTQKIPIRWNQTKVTLRHIIRSSKVKSKVLRAAREQGALTYTETPAGFSTETFQARREWDDTFNMLKKIIVN